MNTVTLEEVSTFIMGQAPPGDTCNFEKVGTPFVKAGEFGPDRPIIREWTTQPLKLAKRSDVLICVVGATAGKLNLGEDCAIGRSVAAIRPDLKKLDQFYLYNYLQTWVQRLRLGSQGSAQGVITKPMLGDLKIPLPPLAEQKRIAAILDMANAIRRKRQAAINLADDFLRATFLDMFGDPVTNPKGWPIKPLSKLCDVRDGTHDSPKYVRDGFPLITSKNVKNGNLDFSDVSLISETDFLQINKRSAVDIGDIIMPMIGTIGNPVLVETSKKFAIKNVALIKFVKAISVCNEYILHLLRSHYFEWIIQESNRGGTQKFIALKDIRSFPIPVPDEKSQQKFSSLCMKLKKLKANEEELNSNSSLCFNSLTQRAFQGEL